VRGFATSNEEAAFDNLARTAERAVAKPDSEFENLLDEMRSRAFSVLWRQDGFVVDRFRWLAGSPFMFVDPALYAALKERGEQALTLGDVAELRRVVAQLDQIRFSSPDEAALSFEPNIVRG
jgi:molecular chaperone DnaK